MQGNRTNHPKKYPDIEGFWVYSHTTPEGEVYIGMSGMKVQKRWQPSVYSKTALQPYIEQYGWNGLEHTIIKQGLSIDEAKELEGELILKYRELGLLINRIDSGSFASKRILKNEAFKIYNRVNSFNVYHPELMIETALEAKRKYITEGYIPSYIKNNDLKNNIQC